ncbi:MAG: TetR/AcrR family transcriptional regulator [Clostridium sp.]|nr:TetR/AcrR family transcriptional regulator [Clostridium sp.]
MNFKYNKRTISIVDGVYMGARKKEALEQFNRDNILTAAKELFDSHGIEKTTMDDIAKYADYSKSTIYVYFKSKEDIFNSIVGEYMDVLAVQIRQSIEKENDFETCYYKFCDCIVAFEERYPRYYATLVGEIRTTGRKSKNSLIKQDMGRELRELITELVEKGIKSREMRDDIELEATVLYIWSAVSGIVQMASRKKDYIDSRLNMTKEEYLRYSFRMFFDSLVGGRL